MYLKSNKVVKAGNSFIVRVDSELQDQTVIIMDEETFMTLHRK